MAETTSSQKKIPRVFRLSLTRIQLLGIPGKKDDETSKLPESLKSLLPESLHDLLTGRDDAADDEDDEKNAYSLRKEHHKPVVELNGKTYCPHCGEEIKDGEIYSDAKAWTFHRPCMSKGSIRLSEKQKKDLASKLREKYLGEKSGDFTGAGNISEPFFFEYLTPPDETLYSLPPLDKEGGGPTVPLGPPRYFNARSPMESFRRRTIAGSEDSDLFSVPPAVLLPLMGTVGGAAIGDQSQDPVGKRIRGGLRGLLTGGGAAAGHALASSLSSDMGTQLGSGAAGGILGYLLARALIQPPREIGT